MNFENSILDIANEFDLKSKNLIFLMTKNNKHISPDQLLSNILIDNNLNKNDIASCNQTHSNNVQYINAPKKCKNTDGLVTNIDNGMFLMIQTADCIPIFIIDEHSGLMGLVHSGWRGTYKNIISNAVSLFIKNGSYNQNIKVYLGPSIKSCCYEVKDDVSKFFNAKYITKVNNKKYLDLFLKVEDDLVKEGVNKKNILKSKICTYDNQNYCSYRRDNKYSGRMYSMVGAIQ